MIFHKTKSIAIDVLLIQIEKNDYATLLNNQSYRFAKKPAKSDKTVFRCIAGVVENHMPH